MALTNGNTARAVSLAAFFLTCHPFASAATNDLDQRSYFTRRAKCGNLSGDLRALPQSLSIVKIHLPRPCFRLTLTDLQSTTSATAMRTVDGLPNSVQAKCTLLPSSAILGKPLDREMSVFAMIAGGPSVPSGRARRTLIAPPSAVPDNQHTSAE